MGSHGDGPAGQRAGEVAARHEQAEAAARMELLRDRLAAGWNEETSPVELIFIAETVEEDPAGKAADDK